MLSLTPNHIADRNTFWPSCTRHHRSSMTTEQSTHRFTDPLQLNCMLSPSEEAVVQASYWETDSSISQVDVQIKDLLLWRHALCNHHQMLATLLSPMCCIGPELLGEIFCYCLPQDYHQDSAHKAVMLPSHVCKHWRDVALSTLALWTNIVLCVTNETFESWAALVMTWFSWSGGLPLSFTLEGQEDHGFSSSALQPLAICQPLCTIWDTSVPWSHAGTFAVLGDYADRFHVYPILLCWTYFWVSSKAVGAVVGLPTHL